MTCAKTMLLYTAKNEFSSNSKNKNMIQKKIMIKLKCINILL